MGLGHSGQTTTHSYHCIRAIPCRRVHSPFHHSCTYLEVAMHQTHNVHLDHTRTHTKHFTKTLHHAPFTVAIRSMPPHHPDPLQPLLLLLLLLLLTAC